MVSRQDVNLYLLKYGVQRLNGEQFEAVELAKKVSRLTCEWIGGQGNRKKAFKKVNDLIRPSTSEVDWARNQMILRSFTDSNCECLTFDSLDILGVLIIKLLTNRIKEFGDCEPEAQMIAHAIGVTIPLTEGQEQQYATLVKNKSKKALKTEKKARGFLGWLNKSKV